MNIVYVHQPIDTEQFKIFLAGPTIRDNTFTAWRHQALNILEDLGYQDTVFVPETETGKWSEKWVEQVEWEIAALESADRIVFWIPRNLESLPGFTTNCEFGCELTRKPVKAILGCPPDAVKVGYLKYRAHKVGIPVSDTLENTLRLALPPAPNANL
jgi:hypothetical protein